MTPADRLKVFMAYAPEKVVIGGIPCKLNTIDLDGKLWFTNEFEHRVSWANTSECQIPLRSLSAISDEDAKEVASLLGLHKAGSTIVRMPDSVFIRNDTYELQIGHNGYVYMRKNDRLYNCNIIRAIDFLRSRSYNCGYGQWSAEDLVREGVVKSIDNDKK